MNGVTIKYKTDIDLEQWEIAFENQFGFIGVVTEDNEATTGWITMCPVFTYISNPNMQALPDGRVNMNHNTRILIPIEFMASHVPERFRPTRRRRLSGYDKDDQQVFRIAIQEALDNCAKIRAARSHLSLVSEIPKGLPRPGGLR